MIAELARKLAQRALEIKAVEVNTDHPFTWTSGHRMPMYTDNRLLMGDPEARSLILLGLEYIVRMGDVSYEIISGTESAGIAPAALLAERLGCASNFVRKMPKKYGLKKSIEGVSPKDKKVLLVEDLISTGETAVQAVRRLREAGGRCTNCLAIFTYLFEESDRNFLSLSPPCALHAILDASLVTEVAMERNYFSREKLILLEEWRRDPLGWGARHSFPKVERSE